MSAGELRVESFRNFADASFPIEPQTAIIGPNGVGKSNLIEALRLLSVGKSFKTSRLDDSIRFGDPFFRLTYSRPNAAIGEIGFFYGTPYPTEPTKERALRVNGQETAWSDYWGRLPSVLFVPDDIEIVIGSPQVRRRYLDSILWQTSAAFRQEHLELGRVLRERSALLFLVKVNRAAPDELHPWDELLSNLSVKIRTHRRQFVTFLTKELAAAPNVFTNGSAVTVSYREGEADLAKVAREEIRLGQNLVGPHRDELEIRFNDQVARRFTSRGQSRAIVLLLKLAEARFLATELQTAPLVLLDDMFSELDQPTVEALFGQFEPTYPIVATSIVSNQLVASWATITL